MNQSPKDTIEEYSYHLLVSASLIMIGTASIFYHLVEDLKWIDAVYFSVITVATVGYGDITPHTDAGKIFTVFYVLFGIGLIATFASTVVRRAGQKRLQNKTKNKK